MNWYKIFWYFTVADNLKLVFGWLSIVCLASFVVYIVNRLIIISEYNVKYFDVFRPSKLVFFTSIFIGILSLILWVFIPSKKDALIIIVGGSVGNFVTRDTFAANIPKDLTKYLHRYMQKEIDDLDLETKKELGVDSPKDRFMDKVKNLTKEELIDLINKDSSVIIK